MLNISAVTKVFGGDVVLRDVSFTMGPGDRIGLVGPNGSGKSTLLKLIAGELKPNQGSVWLSPGVSVGYLPQYPVAELNLTIEEALLRGAGRVGELHSRLHALEGRLTEASGERLEQTLAEYADVQAEFERLGGYGLQARMDGIVNGLALEGDLSAPVATLSGGNKTKLSLARLLLGDAQILLLDEPTNYLDLPALLWLERFLREGDHAYLVVSHDRRFLDNTVHEILALDPTTHGARLYAGDYSAYAAARDLERRTQVEIYQEQREALESVRADARRVRGWAAQNPLSRIGRTARVREEKVEREIARAGKRAKPIKGWGLDLADLGDSPITDDRLVLEISGLHAGYRGAKVLADLSLEIRGRDRVALLGTNGSGKSTLVRCIQEKMPYSGSIRTGPSIRTGVLSQEQEDLPRDRAVLEVFRSRTAMAESDARTYLHKFLFAGDEALKTVGALSYGQRAKLALAILILGGANFLVLDEPTSHMDMEAVEALERALATYQGPLLLISHDRTFIQRIGITRVWLLEAGRLEPAGRTYEDELMASHTIA